MNVKREYNAKMFEIMKIPCERITKKELSDKLWKYLADADCFLVSHNDTCIFLTTEVKELSGIEEDGVYSILGDKLWEFVTLVHKKWKM